MPLCSACESISAEALLTKLDPVPDWWGSTDSHSEGRRGRRGMLHLRDARQLPHSAASCPLCAMMIDAVLRYHRAKDVIPSTMMPSRWDRSEQNPFGEPIMDIPIYLRPKYDCHRRPFPERSSNPDAPQLTGFLLWVPLESRILTGALRLFALPGSPAATSCSVSGRPYLPSPDCPEAFALIRSWMTTCIAEHDLCRATLSCAVIDETAPPILPTRIIDVGAPDGAVEPRLIETNGQRGYYVALSHCWGPPGRRPLMTTQETFHNHVNGISWNTLPQTFRDAITTTRTIGLRYLWIDSLCIIQDSHQDWLLESKRMGRVYEEARLTLAASHAPDSSHGLFLPRPPVQTAIELPHMPADGDSMFVTHMPEDYETISPESGSLATRAWATQEWLLSRRMVLYTAGCLVWSCKTITQRETGGSSHITARNHRWKVIVEKFSARGLTYITDRLIALEGLRTAMANMRESDVYCFGLWKNSMPDQLLWYCTEPAERALNTLGLPTWTWASTTHGVRFLNIKKAKNVSKSIRFDEQSKLLTIQSRLTKLHGLIFPCPSQNVMGPGSKYKGRYITAFSKFEFEIFDHLPLSLAFTLVVQEEGTVGYAILDEGRLCSVVDVYCLSLMSKRDSRVSSEGKVKWQVDWVLVLRQLQLKQEPVEYERIGVGKILWPYWHQDGEVAQVCIR